MLALLDTQRELVHECDSAVLSGEQPRLAAVIDNDVGTAA